MVGKQAEKVDGEMVRRVARRAEACRVRSCCARGPGIIAGDSVGGDCALVVWGSDGVSCEGCAVASEFD